MNAADMRDRRRLGNQTGIRVSRLCSTRSRVIKYFKQLAETRLATSRNNSNRDGIWRLSATVRLSDTYRVDLLPG
jgi:hypothetical protein